MAIQLVEGQSFAADYLLLHKLEGSEAWLANYEPTHERVRISLLDTVASAAEIQADIDRYRPLVHPNLLRTYRVSEYEGQTFVVSEYKKGLAPLNLSAGFSELWNDLKPIIDAIQYAHSLGFVHGGITPGRLLIDSEGHAYLDGFGIPVSGAATQYLAPELRSPNPHSTASSDNYGIAQILHKILTGDLWSNSNNSNSTPLDSDVEHLLLAMLAQNASDRPDDFSSLVTVLDESANQTNQSLSATSFDRAAPSAPSEPTTPPGAPTSIPAHTSPRDRTGISTPIVVMGLAILVVLAAGLFFLLPESTITRPLAPNNPTVDSSSQQSPNKASTPAVEVEVPGSTPLELAPLELAKLEALRKQGKSLATELLELQVAVEDVGGRLWAGDRYDRSTELGIQGDEAYRAELLAEAVDLYSNGIMLLKEVLAETEQVFTDNLNRGIEALESGDHDTAITSYKIVTQIRPSDPELAAGLIRATNLEQVLRLTTEAGVMERNGELTAALSAYKNAIDLDSLWLPAKDGAARINNRIARNRFQDEMSAGFNLLAEDNYAGAKAAFDRAQKILPNSSEPLDGIQQIELARTQKTIMDLTAEAEALEADSRWQAAIPIYEKILDTSPGLSSAVQGLTRVSERATLRESLDKYLSQPHLMQNDEDLATAKSVLLEAVRLDLDSLKPAIRDLSHLVSLARVKVEVVLNSDSRTDVTVYKIRQYGKITQTRLSLIPGVYTFVGKRTGYRDVYQEVNIKGDVSLVNVDISCTEKI